MAGCSDFKEPAMERLAISSNAEVISSPAPSPQALVPIPPLLRLSSELLLMIMELLDKRDYASLIGTCEALRGLAEEQLYTTITLTNSRSVDRTGMKMELFVRTLIMRPDLGALVKNLAIVQPGTTDDADSPPGNRSSSSAKKVGKSRHTFGVWYDWKWPMNVTETKATETLIHGLLHSPSWATICALENNFVASYLPTYSNDPTHYFSRNYHNQRACQFVDRFLNGRNDVWKALLLALCPNLQTWREEAYEEWRDWKSDAVGYSDADREYYFEPLDNGRAYTTRGFLAAVEEQKQKMGRAMPVEREMGVVAGSNGMLGKLKMVDIGGGRYRQTVESVLPILALPSLETAKLALIDDEHTLLSAERLADLGIRSTAKKLILDDTRCSALSLGNLLTCVRGLVHFEVRQVFLPSTYTQAYEPDVDRTWRTSLSHDPNYLLGQLAETNAQTLKTLILDASYCRGLYHEVAFNSVRQVTLTDYTAFRCLESLTIRVEYLVGWRQSDKSFFDAPHPRAADFFDDYDYASRSNAYEDLAATPLYKQLPATLKTLKITWDKDAFHPRYVQIYDEVTELWRRWIEPGVAKVESVVLTEPDYRVRGVAQKIAIMLEAERDKDKLTWAE